MQYRREESFRYEFSEPLKSTFKIIRISDANVESKEGEMYILDISAGGVKMNTHLELPDPNKAKVEVEVELQLAEKNLDVQGEIVWKKPFGRSYHYGIDFSITETESQELIKILKGHIKYIQTKKEHE
ncbi:protein with PilZ signaling domain [Alkalihalophilus pseudofirmus OF4]|uniref:Protein with PilZ signaling domain n=1 Tax=Alkalihalophilus pseudofirmus (strain ATCC BAA-2126 / JCM 17055 / OF4) TaxID=398511 RepID=D3FYP5_ALKPO|nr:PilZ domain-containing protein [Alkalihalophilus pseudofirmus]ADC50897.1 protein with PilZ signaling domain [Alkalihalophilus pseudofirmus OF4]